MRVDFQIAPARALRDGSRWRLRRCASRFFGVTCLVFMISGVTAAAESLITAQGYIYVQGAYIDALEASGQAEPSHHLKLKVTGSNSLNRDWDLGVTADLQWVESDLDDRFTIFLSSNYGNFAFGSQHQISYQLATEPPNFIAGFTQWDNKYSYLIRDALSIKIPTGEYVARLDKVHSTPLPQYISNDELKLTYRSAELGGVTIGVSYAAENKENADLNLAGSASVQQSDILSYNILYERMIQSIILRVSYGLTTGRNTDESQLMTGPLALTPTDLEDPETQIMGISLAYDAFSAGINSTRFQNHSGLAARDIEALTIGSRYTMKDTTIGFGAMKSKEPASRYRSGVDYEEFIIGMTQKVRFGVALGIYYQDAEVAYRPIDGGVMSRDASTLALTAAYNF